MNRVELLRSLVDTSGRGLEIGPGFNPLFPKSEGWNIETLDHASAEDLRRKYAGAPGVDLDRLETVDHVSTGASVLQAVGERGRFRFVVASHVIEHTTDLVGFLKDCEALLEDGGVIALAVPDKRFCFDALRPLASTGQVLQAHLEGRVRHTPGQLFDEVAYNVLRGDALAWGADAPGELRFFRALDDARQLFEQSQRSDAYHDIHAWQFTPSSFRLMVNDLHAIGAIGLREQRFVDGLGTEFMISLSRQGTGPDVDRLTLARRLVLEQQAVQP